MGDMLSPDRYRSAFCRFDPYSRREKCHVPDFNGIFEDIHRQQSLSYGIGLSINANIFMSIKIFEDIRNVNHTIFEGITMFNFSRGHGHLHIRNMRDKWI